MLLISIVVLDSAVVRVVQALQQVPLQFRTLTLNIVKHSLCCHLCAYLRHCPLLLLPETDETNRNFDESEQAAPSVVARRGPPT